MGTPPAKPFDCKIRLNTFGAHFFDLWAEPTGGEPRLSCALISLVFTDIIEMSLIYNSQFVHLLVFYSSFLHCSSGQQKTLLTFGKQGLESLWIFSTCLPPVDPNSLRGTRLYTRWTDRG